MTDERAHLRTARGDHARYCAQPEGGWLGDMAGPDGRGGIYVWGRAGDVRRCIHGRVMIGYEVPGTVPCYWRNLHPFWNPILHRRASRLLSKPTGEQS